jgi:hypothetical protein
METTMASPPTQRLDNKSKNSRNDRRGGTMSAIVKLSESIIDKNQQRAEDRVESNRLKEETRVEKERIHSVHKDHTTGT